MYGVHVHEVRGTGWSGVSGVYLYSERGNV